jgi:hypothetical protein
MFKSLIAATAVAAAVTMAAPVEQAQAKTNIDIDVNVGGGYGWYPGYNPYPYKPYYGVSCHTARKIVRNHGFYNVNTVDCGKPVYQYVAWKFGQPYKVRVNLNGVIIGVRHL